MNIRECAKCWNSLNEIWVAFADRTEATSTDIYSLFLGSSSNRNIAPIYSSFSFTSSSKSPLPYLEPRHNGLNVGPCREHAFAQKTRPEPDTTPCSSTPPISPVKASSDSDRLRNGGFPSPKGVWGDRMAWQMFALSRFYPDRRAVRSTSNSYRPKGKTSDRR